MCVKAKVTLIVFSFFILFNIVVWSFVYIHTHRKLTVAFLDVGQGDAIYIQAPNGKQILVDGGPDKKVVSDSGKYYQLYPYVRRSSKEGHGHR